MRPYRADRSRLCLARLEPGRGFLEVRHVTDSYGAALAAAPSEDRASVQSISLTG